MKRYIRLLALCILSSMAMEQEGQVILVAADGGEVAVSRDIAEKIPKIRKNIEEREKTFQRALKDVPADIKRRQERFFVVAIESKPELQAIVDIVDGVYNNAPVLKGDPQFFNQHTPADIPQQVRKIVESNLGYEALSDLQKRMPDVSPWVPKIASEYLGGYFIGKNDLRKNASALGLDWVDKAFEDPEGKSIADFVVYDELPQFTTRPDGEKTLDLSGVDLVSLVGIDLIDKEILQNLKELYLSNNNVSKIEPDAFNGLENLKELYLSDNKINKIEPGAFNGLDNLKKLYLSNNKISEIEPGGFNGLENLEELILSYNAISKIEPDVFNGLENLKELYLSNNKISEIEPDAFERLEKLDWLLLQENNISTTQKEAIRQQLSGIHLRL